MEGDDVDADIIIDAPGGETLMDADGGAGDGRGCDVAYEGAPEVRIWLMSGSLSGPLEAAIDGGAMTAGG